MALEPDSGEFVALLSRADRDDLFRIGQRRRWPVGATLFSEGERSTTVVLVLSTDFGERRLHDGPALRPTPRGSKLTVSNRSRISALNRLPRRMRSTPESPGPPGPNTSVPARRSGSPTA